MVVVVVGRGGGSGVVGGETITGFWGGSRNFHHTPELTEA